MEMAGAVLAGGKSRRMGDDKRLLTLGGRTLLERALDLLCKVCPEVLYVAPDPPPFTIPARHAPDLLPGLGVLSGIHAALAHSAHPFVIVIPVDAPLLSEAWLRLLGRVAEKSGAPSCPRVHGRVHPVPGCYPKGLIPEAEGALRSGDPSAQRFLARLDTAYVDEALAAAAGCGLDALENINTPEDWAALLTRSDCEG